MKTKLTAASLTVSLLFTVLPALAQTQSSTGGNTPPPAPSQETVDVACLGTAADALTQSLSSAMDTFPSAMKTAFTARNTAWKAAWALTGRARRAAIRAADRQFNQDSRAVRKAYNQARRDAWGQFRSARKACRGGSSTPAPSSSSDGDQ